MAEGKKLYLLTRMDVDGSLRFVRWVNFAEGMCIADTYTDTIPHPETGVPVNTVNMVSWTPTEAAREECKTWMQDDVIGSWKSEAHSLAE